MLELINCSLCGKTFKSDGQTFVCELCKDKDDTEFRRIRDYLLVHPHSTIFEVSTLMDIPIGRIRQYLRESRLEIEEDTNTFLFCKKCKKPVKTGIYCERCLLDMKIEERSNNNKR